ncbi:uncharacterized protein [Coffea arabica]|uniref:Tf2-1-like SH3-like domain-containing protein n=1 Tax=Coffea arabica TaxID=13443 RepID=A0A6P6W4X1_COFAR|nr:uncharacterized protein LOC113729069 [Coffea arabica]
MAPYEALYGHKCRSPIRWDEVGEQKIIDPAAVPWIEEAREKVKLIHQRIQITQSRQKSYTDNRRKDLEFAVGDQVFLKITPLKASLMAGKGKKLQPRFVGPYKILQRVGNVAYKLELLPSLSRIHNIFHVSMLKKYHPDSSHVLQPENIEIDKALIYEEKPIKLLNCKLKEVRNKRIPLVKVLWRNHGLEETTWEVEEEIREKYPDLFPNQGGRRLLEFNELEEHRLHTYENAKIYKDKIKYCYTKSPIVIRSRSRALRNCVNMGTYPESSDRPVTARLADLANRGA